MKKTLILLVESDDDELLTREELNEALEDVESHLSTFKYDNYITYGVGCKQLIIPLEAYERGVHMGLWPEVRNNTKIKFF